MMRKRRISSASNCCETRGVNDAIYMYAVKRFGKQEPSIWRLNGYYITLSMIMNMARTPLAPRNKPPLKGFPR